jgi:O-antigen/teichoic acid export membrane protein
MKRILSRVRGMLPKNHFVRDVSVLVGGTIGGQGIMVLAAPILTRLYTPQDFGLLGVFVALLSLVSVIACLRYELAIPLPDDDNEAAALLVLSVTMVLAVATLSSIPILLYRHEIARLLNTPGLANYLYLVPLGAVFAGMYSVLNFWAVRKKAFTLLAKSKFSQSIAATGVQLGGAAFGDIALLLGQVAGHAIGSISLCWRLLRQPGTVIRNVKLSSIAIVAVRYKRAPLFSTWSALFNTVGWQLPPILFAVLFSPAAAGLYALANRVLSMPMQLLGQAIANVFFSDAAQAYRDGKLTVLVAGIHARLAHIGMPPMLVLLIGGPEIFSHIFGPQWREAGVFAQWLSPWLYLVFITSPLSSTFEVLERQVLGMVYQGIFLFVRVVAIAGGAWIGDVMTAVALFAFGNTACALANLIWVMRASGNTWQEIWRPTVSSITWAVALVSPIILTSVWDINRNLWLFALVMAAAFIAARYAYLMKNA